MSVPEIMKLVKNEKNVSVTGGEPLLQDDIYDLLDALLAEGKKVVLETNGSADISGVPASGDLIISMDIKCPSSGMSGRMMDANLMHLKATDQLKFVIAGNDDLEYAAEFIGSHNIGCSIIFTPVGGMDLGPLAEEVLQRGLNVRVLPQLHKIIWGNKRAV
jgi:7-carboxy-7-deazaguanine synthase